MKIEINIIPGNAELRKLLASTFLLPLECKFTSSSALNSV